MSGIIGVSPDMKSGVVGTVSAGGRVVQTVVDVKTVGTITMGNNTSMTTTGVASSITPTSASNKIYILVQGGSGHNPYVSQQMHSTIHSSVNGYLGSGSAGYIEMHGGGTNTLGFAPHSMSMYDTPNTSSTVTYTLYSKNSNGSLADVYFNIGANRMTITLMEIAV